MSKKLFVGNLTSPSTSPDKVKVMKDSKKQVRYIGFDCLLNGERRLSFTIDETSRDKRLITFDFAGVLFVGKVHILLQEAAVICYSKLNDLLTNGSDISPEFVVTPEDILRYKQVSHRRSGSHPRCTTTA